MTPEAKVKREIDRILKPYIKSGQLAIEKTAGSMFGKNGWPDYAGCLVGRFFAIEAKAIPVGKTKPGEPTALQLARHEDIRKAGGEVLIIHEQNLFALNLYLQRETAKYAGT